MKNLNKEANLQSRKNPSNEIETFRKARQVRKRFTLRLKLILTVIFQIVLSVALAIIFDMIFVTLFKDFWNVPLAIEF